ncbi:MAG: hypothetical protein ABW220_14040 [Burkholderiaceae bacterium]
MELRNQLSRLGDVPQPGFHFAVREAEHMPEPTHGACGHDLHFLELLSAYRATGGLALGSEIAARRSVTGLSDIARAIALRHVISIHWGGHIWMPMFQFEHRDLITRAPVRQLIDELSPALDDWELADWFIERNLWLDGATPLHLLSIDGPRVLDAARALRFGCRN